MQKPLILLLILSLMIPFTAIGEEITIDEVLSQFDEDDPIFLEAETEAEGDVLPDPETAEAADANLDLETTEEADDHDLLPAQILEHTETAADLSVQFTPSYTSPYHATPSADSYWTLPMDITDEAAVWTALTSDITVINIGKKSNEKVQVYLRARPDENAEKVGVVTCETQGVRVLETLDSGWSLVECYSSSFHDTAVTAWNMLVQGYIKTSWLKTVKPNQEMGLVIDKLTQRLYIFRDGALYDTLLVSTGLSNARQPYNETRSGEFITASKVGEFKSDNMHCAMAIRINSGDLLHEVPYIPNRDGSHNYSSTEGKLGTRASHGCIRVQRLKTSKGTNMSWLWKNVKSSSKIRVLIWEDWQGRQVPRPADDTPIYYNPNGGNYYHAAETCSSAKNKTFTPATYGELQTTLSKLKRCPNCNPPLTLAEVDAINAEHLVGGDHDPVLTKARTAYVNLRSKLDGYLNDYYKVSEN